MAANPPRATATLPSVPSRPSNPRSPRSAACCMDFPASRALPPRSSALAAALSMPLAALSVASFEVVPSLSSSPWASWTRSRNPRLSSLTTSSRTVMEFLPLGAVMGIHAGYLIQVQGIAQAVMALHVPERRHPACYGHGYAGREGFVVPEVRRSAAVVRREYSPPSLPKKSKHTSAGAAACPCPGYGRPRWRG